MFTSLEIKNYRGLDFLSIENLSTINVFLGKNNSGKTSILESILLLSALDNGIIAPMLNLVRGSNPELLHRDLAFLFHQKNYNKGITFSTKGTSEVYKRKLHITPKFSDEQKIEASIREEGLKSTTGTSLPTGLTYKIEASSKKAVPQRLTADFLSAFQPHASTFSNYSNIVKRGVKHELVDLLSLFDDKIEGVELIGEEVLIRLQGFDELLPLSFAGDGLKRFFSIWSALNNPDNEIVLIDEIDNGIHHTSYDLLWRTLFESAKANGIQVFISTHSDESLTALKDIVGKYGYSSDLSAYNLARSQRKGLCAYYHNYENMLSASESRVELRD